MYWVCVTSGLQCVLHYRPQVFEKVVEQRLVNNKIVSEISAFYFEMPANNLFHVCDKGNCEFA